jgi:PAS domain S-box-containing protein
MDRVDTIVYSISAVLQLAAILFALRMSGEVNDRRPWLMLAGALLVMFGARLLALKVPIQTREHINPFIATTISLLLLISLFAIRKVAWAERMSRHAAVKSAAERDESEGRYRLLFDLSPDAKFVIADGKIAFVNKAAVKMFGAGGVEDMLGRSPVDFIAPRSRTGAQARMNRLLEEGGSVAAVYEDWLGMDGSIIPVESLAGAASWHGGRGVQIILRDISERKRAEDEKSRLLASERAARSAAEHANRMKDEFLATLSHELRTPLNAIVGWSQLLKAGYDEKDLEQGLATIERNARLQTRLIEDLLDMSRIISGKLRLDIQRVMPSKIIEAATESIRPAAQAKGINLEQILDPNAGPVAADPGRLQQIVWNLLSNAIKFTPKGGRIQVQLARVNSHVELSVADNGQGIAPQFMPYLFDRFRQADPSTTRRHGGLGIGLAITKQLVDLQGGEISAHSDGEGHGASFRVALPLYVLRGDLDKGDGEFTRTAAAMDALKVSRMTLQGLKILVVDDEQDARDLIKRMLEGCNASVITAGSAAEAMPILQSQKPDVLVSDIGMPEIDGYEFIKQVRSMLPEEGSKTPAVALTAFARSEDRTRALMAGYQVHVSKPVEASELLATVASVAGRTAETPAVSPVKSS